MTSIEQDLIHAKNVIDNFDLSFVIERLIKSGWKKEYAHEAVLLYRRFLFLKKKYGHQFELPPSEDMDEAWHAHILYTKNYQQFCEKVYGTFLHHHPAHGNSTDVLETQNYMFETQTQWLYHQEFGEYIYAVRPLKLHALIADIFKKYLNLFYERRVTA